MNKTRSKSARQSGGNGARKVDSILEEIPVPNGKGAIPADVSQNHERAETLIP